MNGFGNKRNFQNAPSACGNPNYTTISSNTIFLDSNNLIFVIKKDLKNGILDEYEGPPRFVQPA